MRARIRSREREEDRRRVCGPAVDLPRVSSHWARSPKQSPPLSDGLTPSISLPTLPSVHGLSEPIAGTWLIRLQQRNCLGILDLAAVSVPTRLVVSRENSSVQLIPEMTECRQKLNGVRFNWQITGEQYRVFNPRQFLQRLTSSLPITMSCVRRPGQQSSTSPRPLVGMTLPIAVNRLWLDGCGQLCERSS